MVKNSGSRTALITGGSSGIGAAISKKFQDNNIKVGMVDKDKPSHNFDLFFECDITNPSQVENLYNQTMDCLGVPDILVINAGIGLKEKLYEGDPEKWQKIFDTNVMGALRCIRAFVPQMLEKHTGHVVFISSVAANQPHPYGGIYSASKTALNVIAETLRMETLSRLKVTTICPGATDTDFFRNQLAGEKEWNGDFSMMDPSEIADDVLYAVQKNGSASINSIIVRPQAQEF